MNTTMETSLPPKVIRIGVLALQGAFVEHVQALQRLKLSHLEVVLVREPHQLHSSSSPLDGLIIPGGESTSMVLIAERTNMIEPLRGFVRDPKKAVWGTCAGLILLSNHVEGQKEGGQAVLGGLEVSCSRNYFGRQVGFGFSSLLSFLLVATFFLVVSSLAFRSFFHLSFHVVSFFFVFGVLRFFVNFFFSFLSSIGWSLPSPPSAYCSV
ncbi:Senecionine N-oxygenase [Balamuthia mandrillaris]